MSALLPGVGGGAAALPAANSLLCPPFSGAVPAPWPMMGGVALPPAPFDVCSTRLRELAQQCRATLCHLDRQPTSLSSSVSPTPQPTSSSWPSAFLHAGSSPADHYRPVGAIQNPGIGKTSPGQQSGVGDSTSPASAVKRRSVDMLRCSTSDDDKVDGKLESCADELARKSARLDDLFSDGAADRPTDLSRRRRRGGSQGDRAGHSDDDEDADGENASPATTTRSSAADDDDDRPTSDDKTTTTSPVTSEQLARLHRVALYRALGAANPSLLPFQFRRHLQQLGDDDHTAPTDVSKLETTGSDAPAPPALPPWPPSPWYLPFFKQQQQQGDVVGGGGGYSSSTWSTPPGRDAVSCVAAATSPRASPAPLRSLSGASPAAPATPADL